MTAEPFFRVPVRDRERYSDTMLRRLELILESQAREADEIVDCLHKELQSHEESERFLATFDQFVCFLYRDITEKYTILLVCLRLAQLHDKELSDEGFWDSDARMFCHQRMQKLERMVMDLKIAAHECYIRIK